MADFSEKTERRQWWSVIYIMLKKKKTQNSQSIILYLEEIHFKDEREIKTFPDKLKLREFASSRTHTNEMPKEVLLAERN